MYYPSSENKGADQLCSYCTADLRLCFRLCRLLVFPCGGSYTFTYIEAFQILLGRHKILLIRHTYSTTAKRTKLVRSTYMYVVHLRVTPHVLISLVNALMHVLTSEIREKKTNTVWQSINRYVGPTIKLLNLEFTIPADIF